MAFGDLLHYSNWPFFIHYCFSYTHYLSLYTMIHQIHPLQKIDMYETLFPKPCYTRFWPWSTTIIRSLSITTATKTTWPERKRLLSCLWKVWYLCTRGSRVPGTHHPVELFSVGKDGNIENIYIYIRENIYIYIHLYSYNCVWIYIYIYIIIYIYVYIWQWIKTPCWIIDIQFLDILGYTSSFHIFFCCHMCCPTSWFGGQEDRIARPWGQVRHWCCLGWG